MPSIALKRSDVIVGVDTHNDAHVAVAIDGLGGGLSARRNSLQQTTRATWSSSPGLKSSVRFMRSPLKAAGRMAQVWRSAFAVTISKSMRLPDRLEKVCDAWPAK
jgi:hypothetical protein